MRSPSHKRQLFTRRALVQFTLGGLNKLSKTRRLSKRGTIRAGQDLAPAQRGLLGRECTPLTHSLIGVTTVSHLHIRRWRRDFWIKEVVRRVNQLDAT